MLKMNLPLYFHIIYTCKNSSISIDMSLIKTLNLPLKTRLNNLAKQETTPRSNFDNFTIERRYLGQERRQNKLSYSGRERRQSLG